MQRLRLSIAALFLILLIACTGRQTQSPQTIEIVPTALPTIQPTIEPPASPTVPPSPASPTPIVEPTRVTTKSNDLSWLKSRQPMSITWKTLTGTVEAKNVALFHYSFSYPADWFVYPQGIQSFPQFETPDQAPPGFTEGNVKIDVGPIICISPEASASEDCYLTGTPFSVDGAPAFAAAYSDDVVPGLQIRTVDVLKDSVILRMTAFINGKPDRIKTYEQIFGYIISTLKFDP
jgi:hypothetical protein